MASMDHGGKSIIIVGAGAASISLAHTIWKEQKQQQLDGSLLPLIKRITILEANDYVGGRVRNTSFEGHTVELGANWISGRETAFRNPIWSLAKEINLNGHPSDRENPKRLLAMDCTNAAEKGNNVTMEYLEQVERFDTIYNNALEALSSESSFTSPDNPLSGEDIGVRTLLEGQGWPQRDLLTDMERAVEYNLLEVWVAENLENLSGRHDMKAGANDMALGQDEMFVEDSRGFSSIFNGMVADLKESGCTTLLLEQEVTSIQYKPGDVKVTAKDLKCGQTQIYAAGMVVSTVSLGVLQSGKIEFIPPLPEWKVAALNEIGMFNFAKVYATFPKQLWPDDIDYLVFVTKQSDKVGHYPFWMRYKNTSEDKHLFMCYVGGATARRVESMKEEELKSEIENLFGHAFGHSEDCRPVSVRVTDWSRNPRFCGSYSYFPKGAFSTIPRADLEADLCGVDEEVKSRLSTPVASSSTLYFAGEAFDDKFNGWVQGGFLSGERVARRILQELIHTSST